LFGKLNVTFKFDDVWQLCEQHFAEITEWEAICHGILNVEEQHIHTGELMEPDMEMHMFSVSGSSSIALIHKRIDIECGLLTWMMWMAS
jgi:hypothetical protein